MDHGKIAEFDTPKDLLMVSFYLIKNNFRVRKLILLMFDFKDKKSAFWGMVSESKDKNNLLRLAGVPVQRNSEEGGKFSHTKF